MNFIWAALALYAVQWAALSFVADQWTFLLGTSHIAIALLVTGVSLLCGKHTTIVRSVLVLWSIFAWGDVVKFFVWAYTDTHLDTSAPAALVFTAWLLFIVRRKYDVPSGEVSQNNITLLVKRPSGWWDMLKGLVGVPVSSVCIALNQTVWAYRKRSGEFEVFSLTQAVKAKHIVVDTGVPATPEMVMLLNGLAGAPRGAIPCRCVWTIRKVLDLLGGKYAIKSVFDYIPGFYAMRIL